MKKRTIYLLVFSAWTCLCFKNKAYFTQGAGKNWFEEIFTYGLLSNPEVIAVNQDILGKQASRIIKDGNIQVWSKPLLDGSIAVGVFNLGETPVDYQLSLAALQLSGKHSLRNIWKQEDMGSVETSFPVHVNRHGVKLFKIK